MRNKFGAKNEKITSEADRVLSQRSLMSQGDWPEPPSEKAYYGVAGEIAHAIEPHTEADEVAILIQFLVAFGNIIGHHAFYQVEADRHYTNLSTVLVGDSSKARKGTSWGHVKRIFGEIDPAWQRDRLTTGLSSGEGLIWAVRDENEKDEE
ncbi:MAG: hypothetical protein HY644_04215 [Acidobacteria bacterium]|nr:hypothetical protein [Acidobacteriota bacterium]